MFYSICLGRSKCCRKRATVLVFQEFVFHFSGSQKPFEPFDSAGEWRWFPKARELLLFSFFFFKLCSCIYFIWQSHFPGLLPEARSVLPSSVTISITHSWRSLWERIPKDLMTFSKRWIYIPSELSRCRWGCLW